MVVYRKRPTVRECLQHSWLAEEEEPPSPSPLMLKIPTAPYHSRAGPHDHRSHHRAANAAAASAAAAASVTATTEKDTSSSHASGHHSHGGGGGGAGSRSHDHGGHSHGGSMGGSLGGTRRSCQTCRDKNTERKRYLSKSREAIFEKVVNSNLKKSLSKSRERLCDIRLTLSKSRYTKLKDIAQYSKT